MFPPLLCSYLFCVRVDLRGHRGARWIPERPGGAGLDGAGGGGTDLIKIIKQRRRLTLELSAMWYMVVGVKPVLYSRSQVGVGSK